MSVSDVLVVCVISIIIIHQQIIVHMLHLAEPTKPSRHR